MAHVAKAMGISRQCAHRWVARFDAEGDAGLVDRSSRPHRFPTRTRPEVEEAVLVARAEHRRGPDWLGPELGVPARTVSRILRRHGVPHLAECDPLTGEVIRSSKTTALRYERDRPGELIHVDVKKLGRIPPGGGWRDGDEMPPTRPPKRNAGSATTTCTQPSMTTPASPTPRFTPTNKETLVQDSSTAPPSSSLTTA